MWKLRSKKVRVKYPVKIGYSDKSGREDLFIVDADDNTVVWGVSGEDAATGPVNKGAAQAIVKALNETKPVFYITKYETVKQ